MPRGGHLERYLRALHAVHSTGGAVAETSFYPAVSRLLEDVGSDLTPKILPVINIRDEGSGIPDGGLFVQRPRGPVSAADPMAASAPERGAIEIKPPSRDLTKTIATVQVRRYLERYGKVLVTTLRAWTFVVIDAGTGKAKRLETFEIATTEEAFWAITAHPERYAEEREEDFFGFLRRCMEHDAPLANPRDLAWVLASHARTALERIEGRPAPALDQLKRAISDTLGLTFEDKEGERFFRSTLVQTLFYGVFSSWVLWHRTTPSSGTRFSWRQAAWYLNVPMVSVLFEKIATPSTLRPLGVEEVMDWTEDVLARVDRDRFFAQFEQGSAVQYFYEPFLEHFDEKLRQQFGVWYTPPEVVDYMVERIDQTLRADFGIASGLADERVFVLDPCVGTGSYLLSVLRRIAASLPDDALAAQDLKAAAITRVYGFEILPAPFVVAHLQLGLLLANLGVPLDPATGERVSVFLTNALTDWTDSHGQSILPFPELEREREAAHAVKRDNRILVVLGNPPYYPFAGVHSAEERGLIEAYKEGIVTRHSLNDLYVRFLRVAERRIVEGAGQGIVCLITHFSYLHEPGFAQVRHILLNEFDSISIDCLNGDSRETGKRTPDGEPDPSIFSTPWNRPGIQVGTAIGTFVRRPVRQTSPATVRYRDFWGETKRAQLVEKAHSANPDAGYETLVLSELNHLAFRPGHYSIDYESWPQVVELAKAEPSLGLNENRGSALIDPDREALAKRIRVYLDSGFSFDELKATPAEPLTRPWKRFDSRAERSRLLASGGFHPGKLVRFISCPLDVQWAYIDASHKLWNEVRRGLLPHARTPNQFLIVRRRAPRTDDGAALLPATCVGDQHVLHKDAYFIPFELRADEGEADRMFGETWPSPNVSERALSYLQSLGFTSDDPECARLLWLHALAIGYSRRYVADNPGGIAADWPRVPLPATAEHLRASAALGEQLANLLDPLRLTDAASLPSVVGPIRRIGGGAIQPSRGDLAVTAQWGIVHKTGAVMPGRGKLIQRSFTEAELEALGDRADGLGDAYDVFLNDRTYWSCIPAPVWNFKIGGFQVLKKWLSYREQGTGHPSLLGRGLSKQEAREFTALAQRLTGVVLLIPDLDDNYEAIVKTHYPWNSIT